jgi:hypothetical protein
LLYAEYLSEDLLLDLPHRQFVFTIPKILRPYFKSDKRLFGEVSKLIFSLLSQFFSLAAGRELLCACVVSYQSFGEFARFHPHWHVLVLEGGFTKHDRFVYLPLGADDGLLKVWQAAILSMFLKKGLIDQARVNMLKDWKHSGFSIECETRLFSKADREALGQYVVRGATSAEKIQYDQDSDTVTWTASSKGFYKGKSETFKGFEFLSQLVAHLPHRRVQLVRRYGVYVGCTGEQQTTGLRPAPEKSANSGKSAPVFTGWHRKAGKRSTQTRHLLWLPHFQRSPQAPWLLMLGQSYASKVGPDYCRRCMR